MSVEAMLGAKGSFDPFVSEARPHIGQVRFFGFFTRLIELIFFSCGDPRWLNPDSFRASHAHFARRIFLCK